MSEKQIHVYFNRKFSKWNIKDFLYNCELEDISDKISIYLKSLEAIVNTEEGQRCKRAEELLARYREGSRPDRTLARNWEKEYRKMASETSTSINFYGNLQNNGIIASEATENRSVTNNPATKRERKVQSRTPENKTKSVNLDAMITTPLDSSSEYIPSEESEEEDELELTPVRRKKTKLNEDSCKEIQETRSNNHIDQRQSSQHEVDPSDVNTNDETDLPETCEKNEIELFQGPQKIGSNNHIDQQQSPPGLSTNDVMDPETCEEVGENEMNLDLQEPSIVRIVESNSEDLEWDDVMRKVEGYRKQLKKTKYAFDPTSKLLSDVFPRMLSALPKMCFCVPKLTEEEAKFIDELLKAEDVDDVPAMTEAEKTFRKLFSRIFDSITMIRKNDLPEVEHTFRNVVPLLDATIGKDGYFWVKYGEQSLEATAIRRNKERDPNERARIGFKVDAMIEYQNLSWIPVIGCLEVSGGLPRCSRSKEWDDTLKLGLELRDLWAIARDQLMGIDVSQLVWWGLTVVGRKIRVYAFSATGGLFHLVLMYEAFLPSSREDLYNLELCYLVLKEYKKKLNETKNMLCELNRKKVQLITRKRNLEESTGNNLVKKPKIVNSPDQKRNKRS